MDQIIEGFEKALAEYHSKLGKKDNLVGFGEIVIAQLKKQRQSVVTLGNLLSDFYASRPQNDEPFKVDRNGHVIPFAPVDR